jgi:hypothetical protein
LAEVKLDAVRAGETKAWRLILIALLTLGACGGSGATVALPSASGGLVATRDPTPLLPPTLGTFAFIADLRSTSEVPPSNDAESTCTGQSRLVLKAKLDPSGKIISTTAQFSFFVRGCPDSAQITVAHIHQAPVGQNGAVVIDSGLSASRPTALRGGEIGLNVEDVTVADLATVTDLIANPGGYYLNVHTVLHPEGLVRGQLMYER